MTEIFPAVSFSAALSGVPLRLADHFPAAVFQATWDLSGLSLLRENACRQPLNVQARSALRTNSSKGMVGEVFA